MSGPVSVSMSMNEATAFKQRNQEPKATTLYTVARAHRAQRAINTRQWTGRTNAYIVLYINIFCYIRMRIVCQCTHIYKYIRFIQQIYIINFIIFCFIELCFSFQSWPARILWTVNNFIESFSIFAGNIWT